MKTRSIRQLVNHPAFIPGIYNYCDRWCERCAKTGRCAVYAIEREDAGDPAVRDPRNEAFWCKLLSIFEQTRQMLTEWAAEAGIDLDALDLEAAAQEDERRRTAAEDHQLARAARRYVELVEQWLAVHAVPFEQLGDPWPVYDSPADGAPESVRDAIEVIRWYQHQIAVKIMRGLRGSALDDAEAGGDYQTDSDGSIKVALIGMDRSISAWGALRALLPEKADTIRDILVHLERLRRGTERSFPTARDFVRPGFDTLPTHRLH